MCVQRIVQLSVWGQKKCPPCCALYYGPWNAPMYGYDPVYRARCSSISISYPPGSPMMMACRALIAVAATSRDHVGNWAAHSETSCEVSGNVIHDLGKGKVSCHAFSVRHSSLHHASIRLKLFHAGVTGMRGCLSGHCSMQLHKFCGALGSSLHSLFYMSSA